MAFAFAILGAFASNAVKEESMDSLWRQNASNPSNCESQDECTIDNGQACSFQVYADEACSSPIVKDKP